MKENVLLFLDSKRKRLLIISAVFFTLFIAYSYFVAREYLVQFDFDITVRLQDNIPTRADPYFSSLSLFGSVELTSIIFLVIVIFGAIKKRKRLIILLIFPLFHVVELTFKTIIDQIGPPFMFHRYAFDYHFPSTYISTDYFSYPSGHVGRTSFLIMFLGYIVWKSKFSPFIKYAILTGFGLLYLVMFISRISLGEHWVSDVIGGTLLGICCGLIAAAVWE